jgi:membrane associated rhomboid family serine protease
MLFPISDDDREVTTFAFVTYILIAINIGVFAYQLSNPEITYSWSIIPKEITTGEDLVETEFIIVPGIEEPQPVPQGPGPSIIWLTVITSMFMHGGFGHIAGNLLYLWIFGNNVEHRFGHFLFLLFYLISGIVGALAQVVMDPGSVIPNLGASGAIAGVMGAYLVLFPRNKVNAVFLYAIISIPAIFVLGLWGVMQFMSSVGSITGEASAAGGVAYMAHVGGFVAGLVAGFVCKGLFKEEPDSILRRNYERDPTARPMPWSR